MPNAKSSDGEFIRIYTEHGPAVLARRTNTTKRQILERRRRLEIKYKRAIKSGIEPLKPEPVYQEHPGRIYTGVKNGFVIIGSDAHYWPGPKSLMHRAFVALSTTLKPELVIMNGDVIDACSISRHPPIGWSQLPAVEEEIEAAQDRLHEVALAAGKARKLWPLGNHDSRFETRLATVAPEFGKLHGFSLKDHFPLWEPCWSVWINDEIVVKHRFKGGVHAPHNNTVNSGKTIITGHLHSSKVIPWDDYNGTRYGVDTGCMADPSHRAFVDYTEDNPKNWRDGLGILEFRNGRMLPPDLVSRWDTNHVVFRGEIIRV